MATRLGNMLNVSFSALGETMTQCWPILNCQHSGPLVEHHAESNFDQNSFFKLRFTNNFCQFKNLPSENINWLSYGLCFSFFLLAYSSFVFRHISVIKHLPGAPFGQVPYSLVFKEVFKIIEKRSNLVLTLSKEASCWNQWLRYSWDFKNFEIEKLPIWWYCTDFETFVNIRNKRDCVLLSVFFVVGS